MDIEEQYDKIFHYCYYRIRDKNVAEDITQEVFLRFYNSNYVEQQKEIRANFWDEIKDKLWNNIFWSDSYFITTTGGADIETLEKYIQDQGIEKPKRKYTKRQTKKE